jgi:molybdate transport repressor ModE-like protein
MEISYRKAWGLLSDIEYVLGFPLTKKRRGGQAGGMTSLTREGKELINAYGLLRNDLNSSAKEVIRVFFRRINAITDKK